MTFDGAKIGYSLQNEKRKSLFVRGGFPNFYDSGLLFKSLFLLNHGVGTGLLPHHLIVDGSFHGFDP